MSKLTEEERNQLYSYETYELGVSDAQVITNDTIRFFLKAVKERDALRADLKASNQSSIDLLNLEQSVVKKRDRLTTELETERIRLAACSVAALSNTEKTVAERIGKENEYWSASYRDVCDAVDREMKLRAEVERLKEYEWKYNDLCK